MNFSDLNQYTVPDNRSMTLRGVNQSPEDSETTTILTKKVNLNF